MNTLFYIAGVALFGWLFVMSVKEVVREGRSDWRTIYILFIWAAAAVILLMALFGWSKD